MLKHLSRVRIEFNAFDRRNAAALEFLAQCNSQKARESNPKCDVAVKRRTDDHPPFVQVTFNNGQEETMDCTQLTAQSIRRSILDRAEEMETAQMFKDAGLQWPVVIPDQEAELARRMQGKSR
ncbi:hypothetical protein CLOM_g18965 [Closterium sp. NIES-68]|nr:hypothetical protein CLOM_g18965 [Closterium sp. NIES-68]GJP78380.1 hypothetical protein CLOP_g8686 [Closterium sp. NIES-67]